MEPDMGPYQVPGSNGKRYSTLPRDPELESHHQKQFSVIPGIFYFKINAFDIYLV